MVQGCPYEQCKATEDFTTALAGRSGMRES